MLTRSHADMQAQCSQHTERLPQILKLAEDSGAANYSQKLSSEGRPRRKGLRLV